ncbi:Gfo/Idh/MocA family protein [Oceaniglobus ichthyenteri]|uniref:Gfo/Idh/MocA family protein n=1 Tax=Oceaniglobus ichthyenteri TaxID=2136177 RepID=UPI000D3D47E4|nr:Gfo/Idh/MocA family oxidoreductase [Oceaniglobus ichthyenteri]
MKTALIGLGMVSATYIDALAKTDITLAGVFAPRDTARTAFLEQHRLNARNHGSIAEIAASDVDFVIVTTPPNARVDIVAELAAAGRPILMEKPVERSLAAATALVDICETAGVPLGIMLQHRARPVVGDLRRMLPELGALRMVEVHVPWWRPQTYYDQPGRGSYARDGGGVLISQAIHTLDLMLSLTGPVAQVTAMAATTGFHTMEAEDFVSAGLAFANGAVGTLSATTASFPGRPETITLHYANGSARLDTNLLSIDWQDGRRETFGAATASGAGADPMAFTSDWHRAMIEDFAAALSQGRAPMVPGCSALEVHRLIDALEKSARTGARRNV